MDIKRWCINHVAKMIYDCIEGPNDRAELDWQQAERFINENPHIVNAIKGDLVTRGQNPNTITENELECRYGRGLFENRHRLWPSLPHPPYGRVLFN